MANRNGGNGLVYELKVDAVRYFKNGIQRIKQAHRKNGTYADAKPLREGAGVMYLGVLSALDAFALARGYSPDKLPQSYSDYMELLTKHAVHNGKLKKAFNDTYSYLHIGVYYRKTRYVKFVEEGIQNARFVIEKLTGKRVS